MRLADAPTALRGIGHLGGHHNTRCIRPVKQPLLRGDRRRRTVAARAESTIRRHEAFAGRSPSDVTTVLFDASALSTASGFRGIGVYQRSLLVELAGSTGSRCAASRRRPSRCPRREHLPHRAARPAGRDDRARVAIDVRHPACDQRCVPKAPVTTPSAPTAVRPNALRRHPARSGRPGPRRRRDGAGPSSRRAIAAPAP